MSGHTHGPGCGCAGFAAAGAVEASLLPFIDLAKVRCLNERTPGSAHRVFRALEAASASRRAAGGAAAGGGGAAAGAAAGAPPVLESCEGDCDLLLHVPFKCAVRVTRLCVAGGGADARRAPARCRLFAEREHLDFGAAAGAPPLQDVALAHDPLAETWHPLRVARFNNVSSLQLFFSGSLGGGEEGEEEGVIVDFIGLRGEASGLVSAAPDGIVYEAVANPADHARAREGDGGGGAAAAL
jgi:hypothetical protein